MSDSDGPEPAGLEGLPPIFSIAKGEVVSVQTYGAFVRLPGYKKEVRPFARRGRRGATAATAAGLHRFTTARLREKEEEKEGQYM
ncbi:hypothetical protein GBF38_011128, partial [Nibea albiflora]